MKSDIEIARQAKILPIREIAGKLGIPEDELEAYGRYKAKLSEEFLRSIRDRKTGKLILVSAVNPTPAGEGKTTVTIGLGQAFNRLGRKAVIALREPSLGPCFGVKGGAAGGGMSQVIPMDELNLHFTGDFHAITAANNLLAAMVDNHIHHGNDLNIDLRRIVIKRCLDLNDRALRNVVVGLGEKSDGFVREDHFTITVASEVMAVFCLAEDLKDLKRRLERIIVAYDLKGDPVYAKNLGAVGAMTALLKDALKPNLVQTLEHTPALVHGGPFANIAHGCNSVRATKTALRLGDYCITEAGFGADLGAEKFFDIKCVQSGLKPDAVVLVVTVRALKYNGGVRKEDLNTPDLEALKRGSANLLGHIENLKKFGIPVIVAVNSFFSDTPEETGYILELAKKEGCRAEVTRAYEAGGEGSEALALSVIDAIEKGGESGFKPLYETGLSIKDKIERIAVEIYGASEVSYSKKAENEIRKLEKMGLSDYPVCMAKTQYSFSDDPSLLGRPRGFVLNVRDLYVSNGAGFIVALTGQIMTMPGLPEKPAATGIDVDDEGYITGLF